MSARVPIEELRFREYWRPIEAARVLGRGPEFWRQAYDSQDVEGYCERKRGKVTRYLEAESCRAFLRSKRLPKFARPDNGMEEIRRDHREWLKARREAAAAAGVSK